MRVEVPYGNKDIKMFRELVEVGSGEKRLVAYQAVAEIIVLNAMDNYKTVGKDYKFAIRSYINKAIYTIIEIAMVDKSVLSKKAINFFNYKTNLEYEKYNPNSFSGKMSFNKECFLEELGIYKYFSKEDIEAIDKDMSYYNNVKKVTHRIMGIVYENIGVE